MLNSRTVFTSSSTQRREPVNDISSPRDVNLFSREHAAGALIYENTNENGELEDINFERNLTLRVVRVGDIKAPLKLPADVTDFECKNIASGVTLDLSPCTNLTAVEVKRVDGQLILPPSIKGFQYEYMGNGAAFILTTLANLKTVIAGNIYKQLTLPRNVSCFEVRTIGQWDELDLLPCTNLRTVKVGAWYGMLKLPLGITNLKVDNIFCSRTINLSLYTNLVEFTLGAVKAVDGRNSNIELILSNILNFDVSAVNIDAGNTLVPHAVTSDRRNITQSNILPIGQSTPSLKSVKTSANSSTHECGEITSDTTLDLQARADLEKMKVGNINKTLNVLSTIKRFEGGKLNCFKGDLNLSYCSQLTAVEMKGLIQGTLKLPQNIKKFECGEIEVWLDLSTYTFLETVKTGNVFGDLKLPSNAESCLKSFECGDWKLSSGSTILDLSVYRKLITVKVNHREVDFRAPPNLIEFEGGEIQSALDLSMCKSLTTVKLKAIYFGGTIQLPSSIRSFACTGALEMPAAGLVKVLFTDSYSGTLDLSHCKELTTVKIGYLSSFLKLPDNITHFECRDCSNEIFHSMNLSNCKQLTDVKLGICIRNLPNSVKKLECSGFAYDIDLSQYSQLSDIKVGNIERKLILPSGVKLFTCGKINFDITLDLSHCKQLTHLRVETVERELILSRQYHGSLASGLSSSKNIKWV